MLTSVALGSGTASAGTNDGFRSSFETAAVVSDDKNNMTRIAIKVAEFKEHPDFVVGGIDFNGDGTQLAISGMVAAPEVHIWTWRTPSHVARMLHLVAPAGSGQAIRYSPDGSVLAVGHTREARQYGVVGIWNTHTWELVHEITDPEGGGESKGFEFSSDGALFIRTLDRVSGPNVIVYQTDNWEPAWGLPTRPFFPNTLTLSPDGNLAAVAGSSSSMGPNGSFPLVDHPQILIVDLSSRRIVRTIAAFPDNSQIRTLAWSPDGKTLAAGGLVTESVPGPDAVKIFDPGTGRQVIGEASKSAFVSGLRYSANGRYLVEGDVDGNVKVWDGAHETLLQAIPVNEHFRTVLSISRDSRYLAIANVTDITVWELK